MKISYPIASIENEVGSICGHFFSIKETAKILRVDYSTIYRLVAVGEIDASKVAGSWRISKSAIKEYLELRHPFNTNYF